MDKRKFARNGMVYAASAILAQAISIVLVPVFTRNLTQDAFGQYNLMISIQSLLSILATFGVTSGYTRYYHEFEDKPALKGTTLVFTSGIAAVMTLLAWLWGDAAGPLLMLQNGGRELLTVVMASTGLLAVMSVNMTSYAMEEKAAGNSLINIGRSLLLLLISALLIIRFQMGLMGALLGQLLAYGGVTAVLMARDLRTVRFRISVKMLKPMLRYGLGLMPGQISGWVYSLMDRYFIGMLVGLSSVGVYSMGYRLGSLMEPVFIYPFKSVFTAFKYREYASLDALERIRTFFVWYRSLGILVVLGISVFAKTGVLLLSTREYLEAVWVVPLVLLSYYLYGLGEFYSMGIHIKGKTELDSGILGCGAAVNVVLNLALIPLWGILGAAMATVVTYLGMNIAYYWIGRKFYDTGLGYWEAFRGFPGALFFYGGYILASNRLDSLLPEMALAALLMVGYLAYGYQTQCIPREIFDGAKAFLTRRLSHES